MYSVLPMNCLVLLLRCAFGLGCLLVCDSWFGLVLFRLFRPVGLFSSFWLSVLVVVRVVYLLCRVLSLFLGIVCLSCVLFLSGVFVCIVMACLCMVVLAGPLGSRLVLFSSRIILLTVIKLRHY